MSGLNGPVKGTYHDGKFYYMTDFFKNNDYGNTNRIYGKHTAKFTNARTGKSFEFTGRMCMSQYCGKVAMLVVSGNDYVFIYDKITKFSLTENIDGAYLQTVGFRTQVYFIIKYDTGRFCLVYGPNGELCDTYHDMNWHLRFREIKNVVIDE